MRCSPGFEGRDPPGRLPSGYAERWITSRFKSAAESFRAWAVSGQRCVPVNPPLPGRATALVADREDPDRIWVGMVVGDIMKTTDGGAT